MNQLRLLIPFLLLLSACGPSNGQRDFYREYNFTEADTLRGMLRPERTCYDVTFYDLNIRVNIAERSIGGYVEMQYKVKDDFKTLQVDLFENMKLERVVQDQTELTFERKHDAVFITFPKQQKAGSKGSIRMYYSGKPQTASNPPWDGGFVWETDQNGDPWVGVACEGDGASLWWPNKDHLSDEPDSMSIRISTPRPLNCVANGNLRRIVDQGEYRRYEWFVSYPINNYNVTVNIAKYSRFSDVYTALDGDTLALDYYVLPYNVAKAKKHFAQVHKVLACYERFFDKYPFWRDGFALVETPYLGMEHQGAIAYGNKYMRGYLGGMIPRDMDWDYIIVHETGHEYFGNSISCQDLSEMWIHESFTTYMEALYVECAYNYEDAVRYLASQKPYIYNREPIVGPANVNWENWEGSDHYYKGAWILHTLRHAINDDAKWFDLLKGFYRRYAMSNITTKEFVDYVKQCTARDYAPFFEQYLYHASIPTLEYQLVPQGKDLLVRFQWKADVATFDMPVMIGKKGAYRMVQPKTGGWQETVLEQLSEAEFRVATELFYVEAEKVK